MNSSLMAQIPGGPGIAPGCAVPVQDASRPLATVPLALRGEPRRMRVAEQIATDPGARSIEPVIDARSWPGCVVPEALVVTLGRSRLRETGPHTPEVLPDVFVMPRLRALLTWGVGGGALQHAKVDWLHGTQLSIAAERLSVAASYDVVTNPNALVTIDPCDLPAFEVTAAVSYGSIGSTSNPARLTEVVFADAGTPTRIEIPSFATSFAAYVVGEGGDVRVNQLAFGTSFATSHHFTSPTETTQFRAENAIPFWNGAEFLQIANDGESGTAIVIVIFGLAL